MVQAWIVSPEESLYFAAPESPRSWASLRRHVRRMQRPQSGRLRVALRFGGPGVGAGSVEAAAFLNGIAVAGVDVTLAADESSATLGPPATVNEIAPRGGVLGRKWGSSGHVANHSHRDGDAIAPAM